MDIVKETRLLTVSENTFKILIETYGKITYEVEIKEFLSCQKPKPFLNDESCKEYVKENYKDMKINFYKLQISSEPMKGKFIVFGLKKVERFMGETDLLVRVEELERQIDELNPYEVVEQHIYPKWKSIEEFKELDSYKYFEACWSWRKHFHEGKGDGHYDENRKKFKYLYLGDFMDREYGCTRMLSRYEKENTINLEKELTDQFIFLGQKITVSDDDSNKSIHQTENLVYPEYYSFKNLLYDANIASPKLDEYMTRCRLKTITEDRELETNFLRTRDYLIKNKEEIPKVAWWAVKNVENVVVPYQYTGITYNPFACISKYLELYIRQYVTGWYLLNHKLTAGRNTEAEFEIKDNEVIIRIYRSKKIYGWLIMQNSKDYSLHIRCKVINGMSW